MEFRILGSLEVFDEERRVAVGGAKQRALLALFVIYANETLSTERLIDELWGERPPATAAKTVQVHISRLRRALERPGAGDRDLVVTRKHGYELRVNRDSVDSLRFARLIAEARGELAAGRFEPAASLLEDAMSLWRGPPLAEFASERFAQAEGARLDELRVGALEELVEAKLALGGHAEVVGELGALIAEHPYRERLRSQLMLALYRCDRQADALQAYQDARAMLVHELGIEPGERLRGLERAILAQDPELAIADRAPTTKEPARQASRSTLAASERGVSELRALPTGTITFLLTDIEGSTRLCQQLGNRWQETLATHLRLLRAVFERIGGHEFKATGDGLFAAFPRARDAVWAAAEAQRTLAEHDWPAKLRIRIGVHTGEAILADDDYVGIAVHRAARICAAANGGQILVSHATAAVLADEDLGELTLRDLGEHRLKDLDQSVSLYQVMGPRLETQFPALRIIDRDQASGTAAAAAAQRTDSSRARLLVGREHELQLLLGGLEDALAGRGRLFLLAGEPGIGKSRLAEELIAQAEARGMRVLIGRCWEAGGAPAYWPWTQALSALTHEVERERLRGQLAHDGAELVRLVPELRERLPELPVPMDPHGEGARFRLLAAVAAFLRSCASSRPLAIFLDDLHAADEPSLLLLRFVVGQLAGSAILIVGCHRNTDGGAGLTATLSALTREAATRRIMLRGLSANDTSRLLEATIGRAPADELAARVHAETEGNPFFATEIGRLLRSEHLGPDATSALPIPETVMEAVARRLDQQSASCRETLALASVIGREFDPAVIEALSGAEGDELYRALEEAASARLLVAVPNAPERLRFSHVLIRDALYESIPAPRRVRLHREIGKALEMLYSGNPEPHLAEVARHFLAGGMPARDKAIEYSKRAGDQAASQLAHEEAVRHYTNALHALEATGSGDDDTTSALLVSLGEALSRAGRSSEAKEVLRRAATLAERIGRTDCLARAAIAYGGRFAWARASTDPFLVPLLERALAAIGEADSAERVKLLARLATATRDDPLRARRVRIAEKAVRIARRLDDPETLAFALEGHWTAVEGPDTAGGGIEPGAMLVELGEQTGDKERALAGHYYRLNGFWTLADRVGVDVELDAIASLTDEVGQPAQRWALGTDQTMLALMEGRLPDAEQLISETVALGIRSQSWNAVVSERLALFVLRRAQGRLAELEDTIKRSVHEYPPLLRFRCALAHMYGELGRNSDAGTVLDELMSHDLGNEYVDAEWLLSMTLLADPCALLDDRDAAARLHALLVPYEGLYTVAPVEATFGSVARALGVLASVIQHFDAAERHFVFAIETERKMKARPWRAHAQHNLAAMLLRRGAVGDDERARALLDEARDIYRELGMNSWAARASEATRASRSCPQSLP